MEDRQYEEREVGLRTVREIENHPFRKKAEELVAQMTLEEKASLCSGQDCWTLKSMERLGLHSVMLCDGPHGLRKQIGETDNLGIGDSLPSTCFPTASALACSFDVGLAYDVGKAIGEECLQEEVSVILGPGVNMKRSPLCGRNFEYYSEDPKLSGEIAAEFIKGVQSTGVGTSLKHFAVNNQERRRMTVNAVVDERALRETYLRAFEIAVKKGKPKTVMCAYNRLNGEYCSENQELLTKTLREKWGYEGIVISDWGAVNDRPLGVAAGLDLEMPGSMGINDAKIIAAVREGSLSETALNKTALRMTEFILECMAAKKPGYRYDAEAHHRLAVSAALQTAVLLKNEENILPGTMAQKAAVIGAFAKNPRYQGAGSSKLHPYRVDYAFEALKKLGVNLTYAKGYYLGRERKLNETRQEELIDEACEAAKGKDIVYIFAGLTEGYESEGFDRTTMAIPQLHNRLIEAVTSCNPNTVVILHGGAPMELPWFDKVKGILLTYLGGEGVGTAVAKLLTGRAVPCGKLAETWPLKSLDAPAYHYFPGGRNTVEHRESIYVGYRYYEKARKPVRFAFGHGLSYTSFEYSDLKLDKKSCDFGDMLQVTFTVTNRGQTAAKETAMIFVSHCNKRVFLPVKELKGFTKLELNPGEGRTVTMLLDTMEFGYYNPLIPDWYAESGEYTLLVGGSSIDCRLEEKVTVISPELPQPDYRETAPSYYQLEDKELRIPKAEFEVLYGRKLPVHDSKPCRPYDHNNTMEDIRHTLLGKLILMVADRMTKKVTGDKDEEEAMLSSMIKEMPFHSVVASGEGMISERQMEGLLLMLNGHWLAGIKRLIKA